MQQFKQSSNDLLSQWDDTGLYINMYSVIKNLKKNSSNSNLQNKRQQPTVTNHSSRLE